jgi:hypothetical protein
MVKPGFVPDIGQVARAVLLAAFVAGLFFMLAAVARSHPEYQIGFNDHWRQMIYLPIVLAVAIGVPFIFAEFSFGYLVGLYFFAMMAAFFWLNTFDRLEYDHNAALGSAAVSFLVFLLPALALRGDYRFRFQWHGFFDRLPETTLCLGVVIVAISSRYGFHLVGIDLIYEYRDKLAHPRLLDYAIHNLIGALIPVSFAICIEQRRWRLGRGALRSLLAALSGDVDKDRAAVCAVAGIHGRVVQIVRGQVRCSPFTVRAACDWDRRHICERHRVLDAVPDHGHGGYQAVRHTGDFTRSLL